MRAALVLNIIESYFKNESSFMDAVQELVQDESKKGNDDFVNKIGELTIKDIMAIKLILMNLK